MAKRIEDRAAFDFVRYSNCWEDADILCEALRPVEGMRILSIASAGDNSFSLLSHGAEVVAVDLSPVQLACVEIRRAGFESLEHDTLLNFLGIRPCDSRRATYDSLRMNLSETSRAFWDENIDLVQLGVVHCGKFESYFRTFRKRVLPLIHSRRKVNRLLQPKDRKQRLDFFRSQWNTWRWRTLFQIFFSRLAMGRLGRDPEFFRYARGSVAGCILKRTEHAITELETHNNPFLTYILTGNFGQTLPHYLRPERFDAIRNNLHNLTLAEMSVEQAAERFGSPGFDGFNLSDVFEYLDPVGCAGIYRRLIEHSRPGARFAYWNMVVSRQCPEELTDRMISHLQLARDLLSKDKAWFYNAFVLDEFKGLSGPDDP